MKILHTSDWHLGQKFISREREEEHQMALDWLVQLIADEGIEMLIVAGDVFDIGSPPNYARAQYYNFLKKLWHTGCRHVIITGGNHDSPPMLNAPKELLQLLKVHVVGCATEDPVEEIIELKDETGKLEAVVAAVPFLRDQDLRRAVSGETGQERIDRIKEAILAHYRAVGQVVEIHKEAGVPIIATGHLCCTGAEMSEKQDNIYLGNLENIRADQFPPVFDYVALGHIHRAQAIGGLRHVRYSGSLIPLNFSETKDDKVVVCIEFKGKKLKEIREIPVPLFRRLKSIEGRLPEVKERLTALNEKYQNHLPAWVEVIIESDTVIPQLDSQLHEYVREMNIELLRTKLKKPHFSLDAQVNFAQLEELEPLEVFLKKCESAGRAPEDVEELVQTFRELEEWHKETKD